MKKSILDHLISAIIICISVLLVYQCSAGETARADSAADAVLLSTDDGEYVEKFENPFDKQDDNEVLYDRKSWIQPLEWNVPRIDPKDYNGYVMLYFDKIGMKPENARGKVQRIYFSISGATEPVSQIKFHFFYDTRLTVKKNSDGEFINPGKGMQGFTTGSAMVEEGQLVFYAYSADNILLGKSSIFTVDFIIPEDAEPGEVYPFGLSYVDDGIVADTFINFPNDDAGRLQMTYVFTRAITNGYIKMHGEKKTTTTTTVTTAPTTMTAADEPLPADIGDVNSDGAVDSSDASEVLMLYAQMSTGGEDISPDIKDVADVNRDGFVDSSDASLILEYYAYVSTGGSDTADVYFRKRQEIT